MCLLAACSEQDGTTFDSLDGIDAADSGPGSSPGVFWSEALLHDEILKFNPEYGRDGVFQISGGRPIGISVANTNVTDLGFAQDLPLQALEITGTQVADLAPLADLPLRELWAERTQVEDLTPLRGVPLKKLHLSMTPVRNLSGLEGAPLEELNLAGTLVEDLTPLADSPIQTLWLNGCPVTDLSPLQGMPLIDLTLSGTEVTDISPLAKTRLLRLYLDGLEIADLTPLLGLRLTRLVFSPGHVQQGLQELRQHESLREIGTMFNDLGNDLEPPPVFWAQMDGRLARPEPYDTSAFLPEPAPTDEPEEPVRVADDAVAGDDDDSSALPEASLPDTEAGTTDPEPGAALETDVGEPGLLELPTPGAS